MNSDEEGPPLDPALRDLLITAESERPGMPSHVATRLLARIAPVAAVGAGSTGSSAAASSSVLGPHAPKLWLALAFTVGLGGGAALHATFTARPAGAPAHATLPLVMAPPATVPAVTASAPVAVGETSPATPPASAPLPHRVAPAAAATSHGDDPGRDVELADERSLIDIARTALGHGQSDAALRALQRHEARFSDGRMVEERESLRVQALVTAGRFDEARARGAAFRRRFPSGFLVPVVDEALRSIPAAALEPADSSDTSDPKYPRSP